MQEEDEWLLPQHLQAPKSIGGLFTQSEDFPPPLEEDSAANEEVINDAPVWGDPEAIALYDEHYARLIAYCWHGEVPGESKDSEQGSEEEKGRERKKANREKQKEEEKVEEGSEARTPLETSWEEISSSDLTPSTTVLGIGGDCVGMHLPPLPNFFFFDVC